MHKFLSIMQDVASVATGGSEAERAEARRIRAERECRAAERAQGTAPHPAAIVAVGSTEPPVERLIGLQSTAAKAVRFITSLPRWGREGLITRRRLPSSLPSPENDGDYGTVIRR